MNKKILSLFFTLFIFVLLLSGCGQENPFMDLSREDGTYFYENRDLGFSLVLPPEFIYYQTQRRETADFTDLEIFVPTSDTAYSQEVTGYAKPIVIRIFNKDYWQSSAGNESLYQKLGESKKGVYTIDFWLDIPLDWQTKWSEEMKQGIIDNFKIE